MHFGSPCVVCSLKLDVVNIFLVLSFAFNDFCWFLSWSSFFDISVNSSRLFLFNVQYTQRIVRCYVFAVLQTVFFLQMRILHFLLLRDFPSGEGLRVILLDKFVRGFVKTIVQNVKNRTIGPIDRGSIPVRIIPKTQKMVFDAALLNTQKYKVSIKGKVEQFRKWSSDLPYITVLQLLKRKPSDHPWLRSSTWLILTYSVVRSYSSVRDDFMRFWWR